VQRFDSQVAKLRLGEGNKYHEGILRDDADAYIQPDMLVDHGMTDGELTEIQRQLAVRKDASVVHAIREADMRTADDAFFAVLNPTTRSFIAMLWANWATSRGIYALCGRMAMLL
jgi:hypothetical protein